MRYGCRPGEDAPSDWCEILHNDIKPANIFLAVPRKYIWPSYPAFKIGDFGCGDETYRGDDRQPEGLRGQGTPGWDAPEQRRWGRRKISIDSRSHVWAVGNIVLQAMNLEPHATSNFGFGSSNSTVPPELCEAAKVSYVRDQNLYELVIECIRLEPKERITIEELVERIRNHVEAPKPADSNAATTALLWRESDEDYLHYADDRYKVGFARPA